VTPSASVLAGESVSLGPAGQLVVGGSPVTAATGDGNGGLGSVIMAGFGPASSMAGTDLGNGHATDVGGGMATSGTGRGGWECHGWRPGLCGSGRKTGWDGSNEHYGPAECTVVAWVIERVAGRSIRCVSAVGRSEAEH